MDNINLGDWGPEKGTVCTYLAFGGATGLYELLWSSIGLEDAVQPQSAAGVSPNGTYKFERVEPRGADT